MVEAVWWGFVFACLGLAYLGADMVGLPLLVAGGIVRSKSGPPVPGREAKYFAEVELAGRTHKIPLSEAQYRSLVIGSAVRVGYRVGRIGGTVYAEKIVEE